MAKKTDKRTGSSSYFRGCFGFSRKIHFEKPTIVKEDVGEKKKKNKKRSLWLLCSKFRLRKGEINPTPMEETEKLSYETDKQKSPTVIRRITDPKNIPVVDKETKEKNSKVKTPDRSKPIEPLGCFVEGIANPTRYDKPDQKVPYRMRNGSRVGKFDPVIGISIIIVTLAIMLIWGRLSAIICTATWCYFLPRFRDAAASAKRKRIHVSARSPRL